MAKKTKITKWESDAQKARFEALSAVAKENAANGKSFNEKDQAEYNSLQEIAVGVAIKAKKDKKKLERKETLIAVLNYVIKNGEPEFQKKAQSLLPGERVGGGGERKDRKAELMKLFGDGKVGNKCTFDEAYKLLKLAGSDMRKLVLAAIKKADPENRVWISIDNVNQTYTLVGLGKTPPNGWNGFIPIDVE